MRIKNEFREQKMNKHPTDSSEYLPGIIISDSFNRTL